MLENEDSALEGQHVCKTFGFGKKITQAVNDVDFRFHEGEVCLIVGESGSGKTTLSKMILGLTSITSGKILPGERVASKRLYARKKSIGKTFRLCFKILFLPLIPSLKLTPS